MNEENFRKIVTTALEDHPPDELEIPGIVTGWALIVESATSDGNRWLSRISGPEDNTVSMWALYGMHSWAADSEMRRILEGEE